MRNSKKVLLSFTCFIIVFAIVSSIVILPYFFSESTYYQDRKLRNSLSGSINYVTIGASHCLSGFIPEILDEKLDCNSYNLAVSMMPMYARYEILKTELERNDIDTVVIEVAHGTLSREENGEYAIADEPMLTRLENFPSRLHYLFSYVSVDNWLNIYSRQFVQGLWYWKDILTGSADRIDYTQKGYHRTEPVNMLLAESEAQQKYNTVQVNLDVSDDNMEMLQKIVDLCHQYGTEVIFVIVPVSDRWIWSHNGLDDSLEWFEEYCKKNGCTLYDFNLIRNRYEMFSDEYSYCDEGHMSHEGAQVFTNLYADFMNAIKGGDDCSDWFYHDYETLKKESPYMEYIQ